MIHATPAIDPSFVDISIPGDVEDAGFAYGRACAHLLAHDRWTIYTNAMMRVQRTDATHLAACAERWAASLPVHFQMQIEAMARGAGVDGPRVRQFLYADIASPLPAGGAGSASHGASLISATGPLCSSVIAAQPREPKRPWVARNCDWLLGTLCRGTAVVRHRVPGRIPCAALGLLGDIDADTGMNAERLWLHMHTMHATDEPRAGASVISWLFWMREALETCATIDDLERFVHATNRDRGVMLLAADGKTGDTAVFECTRTGAVRLGPEHLRCGPAIVATNHPRDKHPSREQQQERARAMARAGNGRSLGTISRRCRLLELVEHAPPEHLPDDLVEILSDDGVEMRHDNAASEQLRTIYSAVADPSRDRVYFASGACPAASQGTWREVRMRW